MKLPGLRTAILSVLLATLSAAAPAFAQSCDELLRELKTAEDAWQERYRAAADVKERSALRKAKPASEFYARFEELASRGSSCAYLWLIENLKEGPHAAAERTEVGVRLYARLFETAGDLEQLRAGTALLFKDSRLRKERGLAEVERLASLAAAAAGDDAPAIELDLALYLTRSRDEKEAARGRGLLRAWIAAHPDRPEAREADERLYRIENLSVGAPAPDFTGTTIDGEEVRLSALRGKVVVLDFFGFW